MRMTKIEKMHVDIRDNIVRSVNVAYAERFGDVIVTARNVLTGRPTSTRRDGKPFTMEQAAFLEGVASGYLAAVARVVETKKVVKP